MVNIKKVDNKSVAIIGGGLAGSLAGIILCKHGYQVDIYERWSDLRVNDMNAGRSINLVLTNRGINCFTSIGLNDLKEKLLSITRQAKGRMLHLPPSKLQFTPYGSEGSDECNYAISRSELNKVLLTYAEKLGVKIYFNHKLSQIKVVEDQFVEVKFESELGAEKIVHARHVLGCDGAGSPVRKNLRDQFKYNFKTQFLKQGYKELYFPKRDKKSQTAMCTDSLHIWPRGKHMLMTLVNLDDSFTGTLYLDNDEFEKINNGGKEAIIDFFRKDYPDAIDLIGGEENLVENWEKHPVASLGTVWTDQWNYKDLVCLIGDASHAIVPFFGQGCNSAFEDCAYLDLLLMKYKSLEGPLFEKLFSYRKPAADGIAQLALENFWEMREGTGDPQFIFKKQIESMLMSKFPSKFRNRYALVVFTSIPYHHIIEIGKEIASVIDILVDNNGVPISAVQDVDLQLAEKLIDNNIRKAFAKYQVTNPNQYMPQLYDLCI